MKLLRLVEQPLHGAIEIRSTVDERDLCERGDTNADEQRTHARSNGRPCHFRARAIATAASNTKRL